MTTDFAKDSMRRQMKEKYEKALEEAEELEDEGDVEEAGEKFLKAARLSQDLVEYERGEEWQQLRADNARKLRYKASELGACNYRPTDINPDSGVEANWTPQQEVEISEPENVEEEQSDAEDESESEQESGEAEIMDEVVEVLDSPKRMVDEPPDLDFTDYGGRQELKQQMEEKVLDYFERKELYQKRNLSPENTLLLHGPPGTGKTYFSKCLAGELGYSFIQVKIADVVSKYIGEPAQKIRAVFALAEQNEPCIMFIDELDAVGGDRSDNMSTTEQQAINQLLDSLSEIQGSEVVVLAATNKVDKLDQAIVRSGRFGTRFRIGMPDRETRQAVLEVHLEECEIDWTPKQVNAAVDLMDDCTPSDIQSATEGAARKSIQQSNSDELEQVTMQHFEEAVREVKTDKEEM
jgi:transitional endoplasmic reticulum ATPase